MTSAAQSPRPFRLPFIVFWIDVRTDWICELVVTVLVAPFCFWMMLVVPYKTLLRDSDYGEPFA